MAVSAVDTVEGLINSILHFHYDIAGDVLYLRLASAMGKDSYSEETADGLILVRDMATDQPVGMTVISYWKRFGDRRPLGDVSLSELDASVAASAEKIAKSLLTA
ncbi:MAG: hypothetical protein KKI08_06040 [Armatimonadetes bacterium]|nr:hypothetical protein [Armatimonadota bacterium]